MSVMKYFSTIMGALCVWLFVVIIIDFNDLLDVSMFVYGLVLAFMITGAHILGTKRYGNPGPEDANARIMLKLFIFGFLSLVSTIVAALALSAAIDPEYRAELSAPFVTCSRDNSQIKTKGVDKELPVDGATIRIHSITTNVPQSAQNPQPYSYECQKATLVELSVTSNVSKVGAISIKDFNLVTSDDKNGVTADELTSDSQFVSYAKSNKLSVLGLSKFDDSLSERGWVAFPMSESDDGDALKLIFDKYGQNKSVVLK